MKHILFALFSVIIFLSCGPKGAHVISGKIEDASNLNVYFDKISLAGNTKILDNTQSDANGNFQFSFEEPLEAGIYRTRIGAKYAMVVIDENTKSINIQGDMNALSSNTYQVSGEGSESSELLRKNIHDISLGGSNVKMDDLLLQGPNALVNALLTKQVYNGSLTKLPVYEKVLDQVKEQYPGTSSVTEMTNIVDGIKASIKAQKGRYLFDVGDVAPEIAMPNLDGKTMKLSDLKGKVVLIDFWASWCGPCRKANPHVVSVYDKYNKDGFEIFSVSLDGIHPKVMARYNGDPEKIAQGKKAAKTKWENAIKQDNLKWAYHVSDLDHWGSAINKIYGVKSIPTTFLVGRDGTFAAINPRNNLEEAVVAAL